MNRNTRRVTLLVSGLALCAVLQAQGPPAKTMEEKKSIAQSQHEVLALLIDKGEYGKVPGGLQKILDLNFTGKYEQSVVDEILILSDLLTKKSQLNVALKLVEMGQAGLKEKESHARLYKEQGFLYKLLGQPEKALEMFEKGRALEAGSSGKPSP